MQGDLTGYQSDPQNSYFFLSGNNKNQSNFVSLSYTIAASWDSIHELGAGFKYCFFSSLFGEMIQFDDHIFQMGWNHQLVKKNIPCFVGTFSSILPSNLDQTSICQISGVLEFGTLVIHGSSYSLSRPPFPIFQWQMKVCLYIGIPKPKHVSYSLNENVWKVCTPKVLTVRPWKWMVGVDDPFLFGPQ